MKTRYVLLSAVGLCLLAVAIWHRGQKPAIVAPARVNQSAASVVMSPAPETRKAAPGPEAAADSRLAAFSERLSRAASPSEAQRVLDEVRSYLAGLPKPIATSVVRRYLHGGRDVATSLEFQIGPAHDLKSAPTLRVWLLDCLALVDRSAAAEMARTLLSSPSSPDEWAVSLRDFAMVRTGPDDVAFVKTKVRELMANEAWRRDPSVGYLEAFDTLVYTRATDFTPDLARLVTNTNARAVGHAAYLTLDRLVQQSPGLVLSQLQQNPELMRGREQTRANYFARGDVRDPEQRSVLERYLLDPTRSPDELQTFAGLYPSGNFMISTNLLTSVATPAGDEIAASDRAALKAVQEWQNDARFNGLQPQLREIETRLRTFVETRGR